MNYRINRPRITDETIDDETIIIDFDTGTYYSLQGTANQIWLLIQQQWSIMQIISQISAYSAGDGEEIEAAVRQFIGALVQAEVIVETVAPHVPMATPPQTQQVPFVPPRFERHTDIQDLLLLDPIHEVAQSGWPMRKA